MCFNLSSRWHSKIRFNCTLCIATSLTLLFRATCHTYTHAHTHSARCWQVTFQSGAVVVFVRPVSFSTRDTMITQDEITKWHVGGKWECGSTKKTDCMCMCVCEWGLRISMLNPLGWKKLCAQLLSCSLTLRCKLHSQRFSFHKSPNRQKVGH